MQRKKKKKIISLRRENEKDWEKKGKKIKKDKKCEREGEE